MLAAARDSAIVAEVQRERIVRVADLAKMLGVSLDDRAPGHRGPRRGGHGGEIHGGAKLPGGASTHEPGFELKVTQLKDEKMAIAQEAAAQVREGMAVGLSAGTTTWALAQLLSAGRGSRWSPTRCGSRTCSTGVPHPPP